MSFNDLLTIIVQAIAIMAGAILIRYVAPLLIQMLRSHNYMLAADIVETAVQAAEQTIRGYHRGEERYRFAIERIRRALNEKGINIPIEQIDLMIEAAVYALNYHYLDITDETEMTIEKEDPEDEEEEAEADPEVKV